MPIANAVPGTGAYILVVGRTYDLELLHGSCLVIKAAGEAEAELTRAPDA